MIEYLPWAKETFQKCTDSKFNILDIELGGQCNYNCVYCDSPSREKTCTISIDKIELVMSENTISWVYICGLGEPTVSDNYVLLLKVLALCEKYNVKCSIFTNLSRLDDKIKYYIEKGILYLLFKYDSIDMLKNNTLYGISSADNQILNIEEIKKLTKVIRNCSNMAASIVPTQMNKNDIIEIVEDCIKHNIYPLIAELEDSGNAHPQYGQLALSYEELLKIKQDVNDLISQKYQNPKEYQNPICPAVINGVHIKNDGSVTVDSRTGLSCHWFWLKEPSTHVVGDFNDKSFQYIKNKIERYRDQKLDDVFGLAINKKTVFGGCGGDASILLDTYIKMKRRERMIYLDNNATTPLSEGVKKVMIENISVFANPSSHYFLGKESAKIMNQSKSQIASLLNVESENIIFTGGATESNNAVFHSCLAENMKGKHVIVSSVEHPSILEVVKNYKRLGCDVSYVPVDEKGRICPSDVLELINEKTKLISIMLANNEIGNIYPIEEICKKAKKIRDVYVHTDVSQAVGKMVVDVKKLGVDFVSISGHKFFAPKGIGCLYIKDLKAFNPFLRGGHQEGDLRAGTENMLSIVGIGHAAYEAGLTLEEDIKEIERNKVYFENEITRKIPEATIYGDRENRVCNTICVGFDGINGYDMQEVLSNWDIYVSVGSACSSKEWKPSSKELKPSHVMLSMNKDVIPIRISISKNTTKKEIDFAIKKIILAWRHFQNQRRH